VTWKDDPRLFNSIFLYVGTSVPVERIFSGGTDLTTKNVLV
jgi:hypothetical protein